MTASTSQLELDRQNKTAMIGFPGKGCLHRTAVIREQGQNRKERTA
jgi:hypothetical protein